ncbi:MAG: SufS family cysteine desulfurase [Bacteroidota bacterium]
MNNIQSIKSKFPIFQHYPDLVYLDSAATTQKPRVVIDGIQQFYERENANIHRGLYDLAAKATNKYESVRQKVADFIDANTAKEIVYTSGTTAGINLVAQSFVAPKLQAGDEVLISAMEHHANLIPWQMICQKSGTKLRVIPFLKDGSLDFDVFQSMLNSRTKFLAIVHISNTFGTINPIKRMIELAHEKEIPVLVDAAQSIAHYELNVQTLDVDFLVFSGHKVYGPTGVGILYGKQEYLQSMSPITFGGDMIREVSFETTSFAHAPQRFEAGTTNIAGVIGLGHAIDFVQTLDQSSVRSHLDNLLEKTTLALQSIDGLKIVGTAKQKSAICSFVFDHIHPHDVATFLGAENIAVRAGNHCTQPALEAIGTGATTRASFGIYNTLEDVKQLVAAVQEIKAFFG